MTKYRPLPVVASLILISCIAQPSLVELSNDGEFIAYAGSVELRGVYFVDVENIEMQDLVCFWPDDAGQGVLSGDYTGNRGEQWLCFSNSDEARQLLDMASLPYSTKGCHAGAASITIDGYARYIAESSGISRAELVKVHRRTVVEPLSCDSVGAMTDSEVFCDTLCW